jgi:hypothetical protein
MQPSAGAGLAGLLPDLTRLELVLGGFSVENLRFKEACISAAICSCLSFGKSLISPNVEERKAPVFSLAAGVENCRLSSMLILLTCREIFLERENPEGELELYTGIVLWLTNEV